MIEQIDNKRYKCVIVYCKVVILLKIQLYNKIKWRSSFLESPWFKSPELTNRHGKGFSTTESVSVNQF